MLSNRVVRLPLGFAKQENFSRPIQAISLNIYSQASILRGRGTQPNFQSRTLSSSPRYHGSVPNNKLTPLEQQRLRRPVSPHLTIYKWQYQSLTSILQRFSGTFLSGSLYVFAIGYVLTPLLLPSTATIAQVFDIDTLVTTVRSIPDWLKIPAKFALVLPFTYHCFNGVKHLLWDVGFGLKDKRNIGRWAWIVAGCSLVSALGLTMI